MDDDGEPTTTQIATSTKAKVGLDNPPFHPKWLYLMDKAKWPAKVAPDNNIKSLLPRKEKPTDEFIFKQSEIHHIQQSTALQMNAASHLDWTLMATKRLLDQIPQNNPQVEAVINAAKDLIGGAAYTNEYITDQSIYIHSGITTVMREHYLDQMDGLEENEYNDLLVQPYHIAAAFNGQIANIVKDIKERSSALALHNMAKKSAQNSQSSPKHTGKGRLAKILHKKYGTKTSSSKVGMKSNYGKFDYKEKKSFNQSRSDGSWNKNSSNQSFPFATKKFNKKKYNKKGGFQQGGRGRDYN